jgi:hypothetical protein
MVMPQVDRYWASQGLLATTYTANVSIQYYWIGYAQKPQKGSSYNIRAWFKLPGTPIYVHAPSTTREAQLA